MFAPQAFAGVPLTPPKPSTSLRTAPPVEPGVKYVLVGFAAAGSAGKASLLFILGVALRDGVADVAGELRCDTVSFVSVAGTLLDEPAALAHHAGRARPEDRVVEVVEVEAACARDGKLRPPPFDDAAVPQLPWRPKPERPDCAVLLLSLRTRMPPEPRADGFLEEPAGAPLGPGSEG